LTWREFCRFEIVVFVKNKGKFELIEPFDTPKGLMKGITPEYIFALGTPSLRAYTQAHG
jgi:hypothetical protein